MNKVYLSLGSNLGHREQIINRAIDLINERVGKVQRRSSFYYSKPWGFESAHDFANLCLLIQTDLSPFDVLEKTQQIEVQLGRTHKTSSHYQDRLIDIDILLYNDLHIQTETLTIPHPLMNQRDFVTVPLKEILF